MTVGRVTLPMVCFFATEECNMNRRGFFGKLFALVGGAVAAKTVLPGEVSKLIPDLRSGGIVTGPPKGLSFTDRTCCMYVIPKKCIPVGQTITINLDGSKIVEAFKGPAWQEISSE